MSTQAQAPAPAQNEAEKQAAAQNAYAVVQAGAYLPVFLQKMAAAGYPAETEEEAAAMLQMASKLRQDYDFSVKSATTTRISKAYNRLFPQARKQAAVRQQSDILDQLSASALQDQNLSAALDILVSMEA